MRHKDRVFTKKPVNAGMISVSSGLPRTMLDVMPVICAACSGTRQPGSINSENSAVLYTVLDSHCANRDDLIRVRIQSGGLHIQHDVSRACPRD